MTAERFTAEQVVQVFDSQIYQAIDQARWACFERILAPLRAERPLATAIDVGCGIGFFAKRLSDLGLRVTAVDGRSTNTDELSRRYPSIRTAVCDIEQPGALDDFRGMDLVFCAGLLYHLENPFRAIRNLARVGSPVLFLETQIAPGAEPLCRLVQEGSTPSQGLSYMALIPSKPALVKMLYRSGFPFVYESRLMPNHRDFQEQADQHQRRTILVASRSPLIRPELEPLPEPETPKLSVVKGGVWMSIQRIWSSLRKVVRRRAPGETDATR